MGLLILAGWAYLTIVLVGAAILGHRVHHPTKHRDGYALARNLPLEPAELHLDFDEETFVFPDKTSSLLWTIHGHQASHPVLIVTHGWNESRFDVLGRLIHLWPMLVERCSAIIVYDVRAHGESTAKLCTLAAREQADLVYLTREMQARYPHRPIVLYGFSMGGGISLGAAAEMSSSCVRARSRALPNEDDNRAKASGGRLGGGGGGIGGVMVDGTSRFVDEGWRRFFRYRRWPSVPVVDLGVVVPAMIFGSHGDRADDARRYGGPLLILHGSDDPLCPLASAKKIAQANPNSQLVVFEQAGHLDLALGQPEPYRQAVESHLMAVASPDSPFASLKQKDS